MLTPLFTSTMYMDKTHEMMMTMVIAISAGVMLLVFAKRFQLPAIVLLLIGGVLLGPIGLGLVNPNSLGEGLRVFVMLGVGLILFEGGLTLDVEGYKSASELIKRLLTLGVLITFLVTAAAIYMVFSVDVSLALLSASMVIVTGPTVIAPLIKRIKLIPRLHNILHWEGVLIDPIGVFVALLCFEWINGAGSPATALTNFGFRFVVGLAIGVGGGLFIFESVKRKFVPEDVINAFAIGCAIFIFGLSEMFVSESGLLSVSVAGLVFGFRKPTQLKAIRKFKAEIIDLLISAIFILLSARLSFDQFQEFGLNGIIVVAIVIFLVRPISILACSVGLDFSWREKALLSWIAPRGIVAASMASLFSLLLEREAIVSNPRFVETFTYSIIVATIVLQGFTAGPVAKFLGLRRSKPSGWMIVGAHALGREIAGFIKEHARVRVVLVDTNKQAVSEARSAGFKAVEWDATDLSLQHLEELDGVGNLLALTDNEHLNLRLCELWCETIDRDSLYAWSPDANLVEDSDLSASKIVWSFMSKPSRFSEYLTAGAARLIEGKGASSDKLEPCLPLLSVNKDRVILTTPSELICEVENVDNTLYVDISSEPA